jgi:hypothetical protein
VRGSRTAIQVPIRLFDQRTGRAAVPINLLNDSSPDGDMRFIRKGARKYSRNTGRSITSKTRISGSEHRRVIHPAIDS